MDSNKEKRALAAIKESSGKKEGEYGIDLFIEHHLEELNDSDWEKSIGISKPTPKQVIDSIMLIKSWDHDLAYDFSLPNDVTDYVVSVRFDEEGDIEGISMES